MCEQRPHLEPKAAMRGAKLAWLVSLADFGHTFELFIEFQLKIDGFGVLEVKYHAEVAPERLRNAPRILGNGIGVVFQCMNVFLDIFSI